MRAVNLIPAEQRSGSAVGAGRSEGAAYAVMVVLAGLALLAFLYGRAERQISSRHAEAATLSAQAQKAQAEASQLAPFTSFAAMREQRVNAVSSLVDSRFDWAHAFHEFGRVLPADVSVSSLSGTIGASAAGGAAGAAGASAGAGAASAGSATPAAAGTGAAASPAAAGPSVTSATPPGSVPLFTLAGCAASQPAVALMLEHLRLIDGVSSVTLQSSTKGSGGGGGGSCAAGEPGYSVQVAFDPIPASSAISSVTRTAASSAGAGSTGRSTTPSGGAR
jgi:hypothetical protein